MCKDLNYFDHFSPAVSNCASIFDFASLVAVPVGLGISAAELKICTLIAGIKKYKSVIKKKGENTIIVLLAKTQFNTIEVLISKSLIDSYINHDKLASVNNVLLE